MPQPGRPIFDRNRLSVKIIQSPLCGDRANEVPRDQWPELLEERRRFCRGILPHDCRLLVFFMQDGAESGWLGFGSRERYLREGLVLDPEMVGLALRGLQLTKPEVAVGFDQAIVLGEHGGVRRGEKFQDCNTSLKYGTREHWIRRLNRDRPDLAERVVKGELSANAAAIQAGFRRKLSPLEQILKLLPKLTTEEITKLCAGCRNMLRKQWKLEVPVADPDDEETA